MKRYIITSIAGIVIDGIRVVQKNDAVYGRGFSLSITYKGNHFSIEFPSKADRDNAFTEICNELEKRNK